MSIEVFYQNSKIVSNLSNYDLCQIGHISTARISDLKHFKKGMKLIKLINILLLETDKTLCNLDTLEKIMYVVQGNERLIRHWSRGRILFPGTILSIGYEIVPTIVFNNSGYLDLPNSFPIDCVVNPNDFIAIF